MSEKITFKEENNKLLTTFLENTFFKSWKDPDNEDLINFNGLEIIMNYTCNLGCKYCYVNRFGDELYPASADASEETILNNLEIILDWLIENEYKPTIELFSGEVFSQSIGFKCVDLMLEKLKGTGIKVLIIPTNFTFLLSHDLTEEVEKLLIKSHEYNMPISLSASFDGKLIEVNRPFKHNITGLSFSNRVANWELRDPLIPEARDDEYYDKAFELAKKWNFGFHPMIYSDNIHLWRDNFLWFQDMFRKHAIPWYALYLLEVRNVEWTTEQIKEFGKFIEFLNLWAWEQVGRNSDVYFDFLLSKKGFNVLNSTLTSIGRGLGCGYQSHFCARLGDMKIVPCHRTSYDPFVTGELIVEDGKITKIEAQNVEHYINGITFDAKSQPYCEQCIIKNLCSQGCLGAQIEVNGDPFTPIPTVCALEHEKVWAMIRSFKKMGIMETVYAKINDNKIEGFKYMENILNGENNE